jgi:hypothetical protein
MLLLTRPGMLLAAAGGGALGSAGQRFALTQTGPALRESTPWFQATAAVGPKRSA